MQKQINYQLISTCDQRGPCRAIAFAPDQSVMIQGCGKKIKVFNFYQNLFEAKESIEAHNHTVLALCFFRNSHQFISGSFDEKVIIWQKINDQWKSLYELNVNQSIMVKQIIINNEDNEIIHTYGSQIKIWQWDNQWIDSQNLKGCNFSYNHISYNEDSKKLIFRSSFYEIIIYDKGPNLMWRKQQRVMVNQIGVQTYYIDNGKFLALSNFRSSLMMFELNNSNLFQFQNNFGDIETDNQFVQIFGFNKQKQILLSKDNKRIHVMKINGDKKVYVAQSINVGERTVAATNNGEYLVIWDSAINQIKILKQI